METGPENLGTQAGGDFDDVVRGRRVHWWGWLLGALAMVAFWGVLIWAVWYFVTAVTRRPEGGRLPGDRLEGDRPGTADPKRILDERLARGDIDADEYRRLRDLLQERDHSMQRPSARSAQRAAAIDLAPDAGPAPPHEGDVALTHRAGARPTGLIPSVADLRTREPRELEVSGEVRSRRPCRRA